MCLCPKSCISSARLILFGSLLFLKAFSAFGQQSEKIQVNIFGDGNPENGIEDSREPLKGSARFSEEPFNVGAVNCDGKVRGTAVVIDVRDFGQGLEGAVLATAAHVLFDLENKRRFKRCEFQFQALAEIASYRAKIDLKRAMLGGFDPANPIASVEFGEGDWAFLYVPKPWIGYNPEKNFALRDFSFLQMESFQQAGGEIRLVAYDSSSKTIRESRGCTVIESSIDDLGGGKWEGQLLDDCDSVDGASGGGIVTVYKGQQYLIGIRSGSHWSNEAFPVEKFPEGPPDGSVWDRRLNTNFGRAIDTRLIMELGNFIRSLRDVSAS